MALVKLARDNIPVRCSFRHGEADKTITSSFSSDTCRPLSFGRFILLGKARRPHIILSLELRSTDAEQEERMVHHKIGMGKRARYPKNPRRIRQPSTSIILPQQVTQLTLGTRSFDLKDCVHHRWSAPASDMAAAERGKPRTSQSTITPSQADTTKTHIRQQRFWRFSIRCLRISYR